jgi:bla regulator protein BlaR1
MEKVLPSIGWSDGAICAGRLRPAQDTALGASTNNPQTVPQWQIDAGGKMTFDVASVKQNLASQSANGMHSNVDLSAFHTYSPTGSLFSATNYPLSFYIQFAYKLTPTQYQSLSAQLPKWTAGERFDVEARAPHPNPTKDQMRLMMQSLLMDRFKLTLHFETRQGPVLALVLAKPEKKGPPLVPHAEDPPCAAPGSAQIDGWPAPTCGALLTGRPTAGRWRFAMRDVTMKEIADSLTGISMGVLDRPVLDQTKLGGTFDLRMEFAPQRVPTLNGAPYPNFTPNEEGPTFLEALQEQLGLKLVPQTGPVDVLVIDHVEQPSEN